MKRALSLFLFFAALSPCAPQSGGNGGYVGSKVCAQCHPRIYANYVKTAMGRSVVPAADTLGLAPSTGAVAVQGGGLRYEVSRRGGEIYQTESQSDSSGALLFKNSYRLEYAIGSGVNGITYAIRRDNRLFEAPLSYYSRMRTWQLSPGYEGQNTGFSRPIATACILCHSGRPQPVAGHDGLYADPPFAELAIGCERCHGPGAQHVRQPGKATIVNPARLTPSLADDICMNCHQAGDTRIFQPGKTYADFTPGSALGNTVAIFKIPLDPAAGPPSNLLEHNFAMSLSRCFRSSNGRMSCLSCHDPHAMPDKQDAAGYYEKKCLACHTAASCKLTPGQRASEPTGCIGCHMPKADVGFISHSALTNHRIVARRDEPLPAIAYKQTTPDLPDLIYLDRPNAGRVTPIVLFQAYGELMDGAPQYKARYLELLDTVAATSPEDPLVQAALGMKAFQESGPDANQNTIAHLSKAIKAGFASPAAFENLATALSKDGRTAEAIDVLKQGIDLSPYAPRLQKLLMVQYINAKRYDLAKAAMQHYMQLFPEDGFVRDLLRKAGG